MRLAFFGDVIGKSGRDGISDHLPGLKRDLKLDFVVVNAENAAGGFGITENTARELFMAGADCLTLGNHSWDQREALTYIVREPRLIRPANYPRLMDAPGAGANLFETDTGRTVLVMNVLGRVHMDPMDDPFGAVERELAAAPLGAVADAVIVDMHCEATSEKMAMGHFCDGRASLVVGTHTHVPTADTRVLPGGTAYQTDAGMTGPYDSIIGMEREPALASGARPVTGHQHPEHHPHQQRGQQEARDGPHEHHSGHMGEAQVGHAEHARLCLAQLQKRIGANHRSHQTTLTQLCHVVDTPRRAGASIGHCANHAIGFLRQFVQHIFFSRHRRRRFAQRHHRRHFHLCFHALDNEFQQVIGIALAVVEHAEAYAVHFQIALLAARRSSGRRRFGDDQSYHCTHFDFPC